MKNNPADRQVNRVIFSIFMAMIKNLTFNNSIKLFIK